MGDVIDFEEYRRRRLQGIKDRGRERARRDQKKGLAEPKASLPQPERAASEPEDRPADKDK